MKMKLLVGYFVTSVLLMGCKNAKISQMPQEVKINQVQFEQTAIPNGITLVNLKNPIKLGDTGSITIQGQAGVKYTIIATYKVDDKIVNTTQIKIAGSDGLATWTWYVDPKTVPGTYSLAVEGGNSKFTAVYTVIQ